MRRRRSSVTPARPTIRLKAALSPKMTWRGSGCALSFFSNSASGGAARRFRAPGRLSGAHHHERGHALRRKNFCARAGASPTPPTRSRSTHYDYTLAQTFKRYFDIGVVFAQANELNQTSLGGEGFRYVGDLLRFLTARRLYTWLPKALFESAAKWVGLSLGKKHRQLPRALVKRASMHRGYWR